MAEQWIQFALLMLTLLGLGMRNEHRMSILEERLETEKAMRTVLEKRIDKLEDRLE